MVHGCAARVWPRVCVSGGGLSGLRRAEQEATAAKLQLNEKLDFEMVGKTVFQLKEDIASLKEKNAVRRAQREKMVRARVCLCYAFSWCPSCAPDDSTCDGTDALRTAMRFTQRAAAKIMEAKLAKETGIVRMLWRVEPTAAGCGVCTLKEGCSCDGHGCGNACWSCGPPPPLPGILAERGCGARDVRQRCIPPQLSVQTQTERSISSSTWATTEVCVCCGRARRTRRRWTTRWRRR